MFSINKTGLNCMKDYISKNYTEIRPVDKENLFKLFKLFLEADKKSDSIKLLEPGCGPGRLLNILATIPNLELTGIDIRKDIVDIVHNALVRKRVDILHGDFLNYNFEETKYDYVLFSHYLHLQSNAGEHIAKAKSLLKDNGRLLFLFEDCSYYSLLLGYPPALAEHHPFLQLFRSLQLDDSLKNKFKPYGPYLPHEIMTYCLDGFNLFPVFSTYSCKKVVDWSEECKRKNASVFSSLSDDDIRNCVDMGISLAGTFQIEPYLFYTDVKLSYDPLFIPYKKTSHVSTKLNAWQSFDYLQCCFSDLFKKHPSVFPSMWEPLHISVKEDIREVFFAGMIPKSELSNWYFSYKNSLDKFPQDYSPSYIVATKTNVLNPYHPEISLSNLQAELKKFYNLYNVKHSNNDIKRYIDKSLKPTLDLLDSIHKYSNYTLDKLYFTYINYRLPNGAIVPIVVLSTSKLNYPEIKSVGGIFKELLYIIDDSVRLFRHSEQNKIKWTNLEETSLKETQEIIKKKAVNIIEGCDKIFASKQHKLQYIIKNFKKPPAFKADFEILHGLFEDKDISKQFESDNDMVCKLYCLYKRYNSKLLLWDWLDYIKSNFENHKINCNFETRNSLYYFEVPKTELNKLFEIANQEMNNELFTWIHTVSRNKNNLCYKVEMKSKREIREDFFRIPFEIKNQSTIIWCHVFQALFGGPLFQFKINKWIHSKIYEDKDILKTYLFITCEEKEVLLEGCKQWNLKST